ncbi:hypothetical protein ALC56_03612, partial [Trachymyrmex septentrionalis]
LMKQCGQIATLVECFVSSRDEKSLIWQEIDAAFESSILMGAVVNVNYIEPRLFLEDAREIVLERV